RRHRPGPRDRHLRPGRARAAALRAPRSDHRTLPRGILRLRGHGGRDGDRRPHGGLRARGRAGALHRRHHRGAERGGEGILGRPAGRHGPGGARAHRAGDRRRHPAGRPALRRRRAPARRSDPGHGQADLTAALASAARPAQSAPLMAASLDRTSLPDAAGHFGPYGGVFVPETLMAALEELDAAYAEAKEDPAFAEEFRHHLKEFAGRPTQLYYAERLTRHFGGAKLYLKREDLLHTGAHKINNALGQALLARRMGKKRIIAETGAGQHGVATATVCALLGLECVVYMGEEDMRRQRLNVFRMRLLGAKVAGVTNGSRTLKDAISEAMRDWVTNVADTYYLLGSALGAHPYPMMVRDFHKVIGEEERPQILEAEGRLPDVIFA